jgi:hypothetical protein
LLFSHSTTLPHPPIGVCSFTTKWQKALNSEVSITSFIFTLKIANTIQPCTEKLEQSECQKNIEKSCNGTIRFIAKVLWFMSALSAL